MTGENMPAGVLLTMITITKGDPEGCERTVRSAAALHADERFEHVVVDGDGLAQTSAESAGCVWVRQKGTGIASAFNEGLAVARGRWVWFLNGGDRVHPRLDASWLLSLLMLTKAEVLTAGIQYDGDAEFRPAPPVRYQWPPLYSWPAHPSTLVRRETLADVGGFDPSLSIAMDYDLWMRLLPREASMDVLSIPLSLFDVTGMSQRPQMKERVRRETAYVLKRYRWRLLRAWLGRGKRLVLDLYHAGRAARAA